MNSTTPNPESKRSELRPPQFRLGTLLLLITLLCAMFAVMGIAGPIATFLLILLILSVIAHVAGNAIGTRLREVGTINARLDSETERAHRALQQGDYAPATRLGSRYSLGRPLIFLTIGGILLGGLFGATLFLMLYRQQATLFSISCGVVAMSALGGFLAFLSAGFLQVATTALWQASAKK